MKKGNLLISLALLQAKHLKKIDTQLSLHGISFSEFLVMHYLNHAPNKTMRRIDLAENVCLSASGVTRLLNPMEKIKLVQKETNPRDARVSLVKLSEAGEQVYDDAVVSFEQSADSILNPLNEDQISNLSALTNALLSAR
ncbi:MarR family transcriptional regulator [uncultured Desulfuromusa sp.]|uniref:MarR family winged helix-turn-helix transcriptional regulator n=1 Tax=uncultured Desulfuromusa sp. TaxID=219183 RepID=UPI002AA72C11|nr:MarR family transcriptional regulator [uncultured Desulfuromusa sp.]